MPAKARRIGSVDRHPLAMSVDPDATCASGQPVVTPASMTPDPPATMAPSTNRCPPEVDG